MRRLLSSMRAGAIGASLARICRNGALMFAILVFAPLLPLEDHPWLLLALSVPLLIFFYLILKDLHAIWRSGAWRAARGESADGSPAEPEEPTGARIETEHRRHSASRVGGTVPLSGFGIGSHRIRVSQDAFAPARETRLEPPASVVPHAVDEWEAGLSVDVESVDEGMVDVLVRVSDGHLAGRTRIRTPLENALRFGDALRGFPTNDADRRDVTLGTFDARHPDGGLRVVLFRRAGASHAYVTVWPDAREGSDGRQSLSVSFGVRPANVNVFVQAVAAAPLEPGIHAELPMAGMT